MQLFLKSKTAAWLAFILVTLMLAVTFRLRGPWWTFIDIFFFFMMAFVHLMATTFATSKAPAAKKLDLMALIFAIAGIIAFIVEWIIFNIVLSA